MASYDEPAYALREISRRTGFKVSMPISKIDGTKTLVVSFSSITSSDEVFSGDLESCLAGFFKMSRSLNHLPDGTSASDVAKREASTESLETQSKFRNFVDLHLACSCETSAIKWDEEIPVRIGSRMLYSHPYSMGPDYRHSFEIPYSPENLQALQEASKELGKESRLSSLAL